MEQLYFEQAFKLAIQTIYMKITMKPDNYIQDVVLPYFNSFLQQDVDMGLFTPDGVVLACTTRGAQGFGLSIDDVIGLSYKTLNLQIINKICRATDTNQSKLFAKLFSVLGKLNDIVVKEQKVINYIDVIPYKYCYNASLITHIPIFNPENGNVVATQTIGSDFHLFGMVEYINNLHQQPNLIPLSTNPAQSANLNLPDRQHEVLFLLLIGLSQSEVATVLDISRGTVSSTITNHLCKKFEVDTLNTTKLLAKARKLNFHKYIPLSLYKPRIIIMDNEIKKKYF